MVAKKLVLALAAGVLLALVVASAAAAFPSRPHRSWGRWGRGHHPAVGGAVVSVEEGPYGPVLVVGGAGAGYVPAEPSTPAHYIFPAGSSLYFATVDPPAFGFRFCSRYQAGCMTTLVEGTSEGTL